MKPDPSICSEQLGATPLTFTMLCSSSRSPASFSTAGLGGPTASAPSAPSAPKTCAYGPLSRSSRKSENTRLAWEGIRWSTARSTAELFTCREMTGNGAYATAEPISHAISSTASALTTAPQAESTSVAGFQVTRERTATPTPDASSWPIMAARNTTMMAVTASQPLLEVTARAIFGPNTAPIAPPPMKPTKLSTPMMNPCRYPATAKATTSTIRIRSSKSPGTSPTV